MAEEINNKFLILAIIRSEGSKTISELAKRLNVTRPTIYLHLDTLEKQGFIKRSKNKEKKGAPVRISPIEKNIKAKEKKDIFKVLKYIKEHPGLTIEQIKGSWVSKVPLMQAQLRGLITKKIYLTKEGEKFLKNN